MEVDFEKLNKIYFIGIGGIGLSAIARFMKEKGKKIRGSDVNSSPITDNLEKKGIEVCIGQSGENIESDIDLVIHTMAIPENNLELQKAKESRYRKWPNYVY